MEFVVGHGKVRSSALRPHSSGLRNTVKGIPGRLFLLRHDCNLILELSRGNEVTQESKRLERSVLEIGPCISSCQNSKANVVKNG